ncbi:MAG: VIT1/CCC1 transporter family protein, partial [Chloroflexi bacterium]|nr:VIT1/CCC1 transporter family protein [Chloroflexota bacterium]
MNDTTQSPKDLQRKYRRYLDAEREAIALYSAMLAAEKEEYRTEVLRDLIAAEQRHAVLWAGKLGFPPGKMTQPRKTARVRLLGLLSRVFGTKRILAIAERLEGNDTAMYGGDPEAVEVMEEEVQHAETLRGLQNSHPSPHQEVARGGWESASNSGAYRAGVLGINDGLVSNFGLVWGVAGGTADPYIILLAGTA